MEERRKVLLAEGFRYLFWVGILGFLVNGLTNEELVAVFPGLYLPGQIVSIGYCAGYGAIFWKMQETNDKYRVAGICQMVLAVLSALTVFVLKGEVWTMILLILTSVVGLVGEYHEYTAHAEVLEPVDGVLSQKWSRLWKWNVGLLLSMLGSIVVTAIIPIIGAFVLLGATIGLIVVGVLYLVYLYQAKEVFRK